MLEDKNKQHGRVGGANKTAMYPTMEMEIGVEIFAAKAHVLLAQHVGIWPSTEIPCLPL